MTFIEYLNNDSCSRSWGVIITKEDVTDIRKTIPGKAIIDLKIGDSIFSYLLTEHSDLLFTMDSDENKKSSSCFIFKGDL
jgi:hypothetical protein